MIAPVAVAMAIAVSSGQPLFPAGDPGVSTPRSLDHPAVTLVDTLGQPVARSGRPVSPLRSCGGCHDGEYIASNSYHTQVEDPGERHPGGGVAAGDGVEFNCFICHLPAPDNAARIAALDGGYPAWAATATLGGTGLVEGADERLRYNAALFDADGRPIGSALPIISPTSRNCGLCHGLVHEGEAPVEPRYRGGAYETDMTGQIFSSQRIYESAMNVAGKDSLTRPWDVHAERLLDCTHCHFSLNDPAYTTAGDAQRPEHLQFDGRRQNAGEFLRRPSHHFAKGRSVQGTVADHLDGTMRRCEDCHNATATHGWLPYTERHLNRLMCESCHVPRVYAPARRATDWTVVTRARAPRTEYRGVRGTPGDARALVDGYRPLLVPRTDGNDGARIGPVNVVASWYWVSRGARVDAADLERAFFDGDDYHRDIVGAFDDDGGGTIADTELVIDNDVKHNAVRARLEALGVDNPRIIGELQPLGIHHTVASGKWATRACDACHAKSSILSAPFELAAVSPGGVTPTLVDGANVSLSGRVRVDNGGALVLDPDANEDGFYILGHDRWGPGDAAGLVVILGAALGVLVHGGLRYRYARRREGSQ